MTTRKTIALTEYTVLLVCVCNSAVSDFFCNLMDYITHQAPLSMEFAREEH